MLWRLFLVTAITSSLIGFAFGETAAYWPSWRGPSNSGSKESGAYPVNFDADRVHWKTELPGKGCSTPIVWDDTIYVTAPVDGDDALLAFDAEGREAWRTTFGPEDAGKHRNGSGSNASPVTDGEAVFVYFKSGTLASVEFDGAVRWSTNLVERYGRDTLFWDHGTSPVVTEKYVIMTRMHTGASWIAAFAKDSGELAWKIPRDYKAPMECDHGYTTPLYLEFAGEPALLIWGAQHLTIHREDDGKLLWTCGNFNPNSTAMWPAIATPVIVDDIAVVAFGRNDRRIPRLHGIRLDGVGDVTDMNHIWQRDDVGTFVPSPVAYQGRVYLVGDHGGVSCLDPTTGKTIWSKSLPKNRASFYASPLIAGGKLYAPREDGVVFVGSVDNDKFQLLAQNDMGESVIGSPVPMQNRVLIRGERHLFCVSGN